MGTGGFQVGAVQCVGAVEAEAMANEIRRAVDDEATAGQNHDQGVGKTQMPRHVARRLGMAPAAEAVPMRVAEQEEAVICGPRR